MRITLNHSLGGKTIDVPKGLAGLLIKAGRATLAEVEEGGSPEGPGPGQQQVQPMILNKTTGKPPPPPEPVPEPEPVPVPEASAPGAPPSSEVPVATTQDVRAMLKADLVATAQKEGIKLDGSETKADLITRIERHRRRYSRRDMQAK